MSTSRGSTRRLLEALAAVLIFTGALWLFHRELARYDHREILAQVHATPGSTLAVAVAWTVASYLLLTVYDVLALRHVGHPLPYPRVAATSFTSYVASHNLGLSGLGGTAVRYRLYSSFGLSIVEIAEVVAFCALTFWVGFLLLGGLVFVAVPVSVPGRLHLPAASTFPLGIAFLLVAGAFVVWTLVLRRPLRVRGWKFDPPARRLLLLQIPLALVDWMASAAVVYALLPAAPGVTFRSVLSVYLTAQAAGMLSHVPAGLGVFDTVFLLMLPGSLEPPAVVGALLLYRVVYYLLPLVVGAVTFVGLELFVRKAQVRRTTAALAAVGDLAVPRVLAVLTAVAGAVLLVTGALPASSGRMAWIRRFLPIPLVEVSHFLGSLVGVALLLLARGLQRRLDAAWWLSSVLLGGGILFALTRGLDWEEALLLAVMLLLLLPFRSTFQRRASLFHESFRPGWLLAIGMVVVGTTWLGLFVFRRVDYDSSLWWRFTYSGDASRFMRGSAGAMCLLVIVGTMRLLRVTPPRPLPPTPEDLARVRSILATEPGTAGHLALLGDKHLIFAPGDTALLMFAIQDTTWVSMGDPVGPREARKDLIWRFREMAEPAGGRVAFYQASEENLALYVNAGLSMLKIGEEARVDLATFSLQGGSHKGLRSSLRHAERDGLTFEVLAEEELAPVLEPLRAISDAWLAAKKVREKGFSLGFFEPRYLAGGPVAVIRGRAGDLVAFANLWLGAPGPESELSVDLMRYRPDAPGGLMDFLFTQVLGWGQEHGFRWFSLGMAPLAGLEERRLAPVWNRIGSFVFRHGEHFYNFQGLHAYKDKFDPVWTPRYLVSPGGLQLVGILADVVALISGGLSGAVRK